ncbi:aminopeptidase PaaP [Microbacterium aoyamense]|uniref:Aminopeptidase PaaP n=1 Tax=Microbacterium aoyamense TaxID=344166 RepID=A0ABN2PLZ7_9MICO|nr:M20/M25/M40 family metallo-hydrolase [Microbacterium aoyamense]
MSPKIRGAGAVIAAAALLGSMALATPAYAVPKSDVDKITKAVTVDGVLKHLKKLQQIADANGGNRAAGQPGYSASVNYVVKELRAAGYSPQIQEFGYTNYADTTTLTREDPATAWAYGSDFIQNRFDTGVPEGTGTGPLAPVDLVVPFPANGTSTSGCEAADFAGFVPGSVALIQRGSCDFTLKALNAQNAGAVGVIVTNDGRDGLVGMIGDATGLTIPVIFAASGVGEDLAATPGATVSVTVASTRTVAYNVLAETKTGDDANVVMAGAHLDSVLEGAGINDNGTGSAALLETAIQMKKMKPTNTVRFAWWGAEEEGLLGSEHYVSTLTPEQIEATALYLNFDMIGSPNYMLGVYDGDQSDLAAPVPIPAGSAQIEAVFKDFFAQRGLFSVATEFSGRSDYGPFIAVDIPAGGLFTGAEGVKTANEAAQFGGKAGVAYDPCYHAACDNFTGAGQDPAVYGGLKKLKGNVSKPALDVNSDAVAAAIVTFAADVTSVRGADVGARKAAPEIDINTLRDWFTQ